MKDPLLYTENELNELSENELNELLMISNNLESRYNTEQMGLKILINSLYGALANKWFPLFNEAMAQAITGNGRYFIQMLAIEVEKTLQNMIPQDKPYTIGGDTDSIYFSIASFVNLYKSKNPGLSITECVNWSDNFEKKIIQPCVQQCIKTFSEELNAFNSSVIGVEREVICDKGVLSEKKKYYIRVRDSEGVRYPEDKPYIKIMGLEAIKSSTPQWSKKYLKEAVSHILDKNEEDLRAWIQQIKEEFIHVDLNLIATVGGVSNLDYVLGDKGIPIGARSALVHNKFIKDNNLENSISPIQGGDKTKRLFLQEPNVFNSNIIAFTNSTFIDYIDCVDYDEQFYKGFLRPLELMVLCLKYDLNKETESIDSW